MTTAAEDRRRRTYARLAAHADPLLREMGVQLGDGVLRPSDLLTDPSYRNVLARSLRRVQAMVAASRGGAEPGRPRPVPPAAGPGDTRGHPRAGGGPPAPPGWAGADIWSAQ